MMGILQLLAELAEGRTVDELNRALQDVRERVVETGKPGKVTLSLTFKPATKGNRAMHSVSPAVTTTLPKGEPEESIVFVTEGGYSRRDPRQPEMPGLREVATAKPSAEYEAVNE